MQGHHNQAVSQAAVSSTSIRRHLCAFEVQQQVSVGKHGSRLVDVDVYGEQGLGECIREIRGED